MILFSSEHQPKSFGFLGQSSEDTWALIKMAFIDFAKSLLYTPIAIMITAILLSYVNSVIRGEIIEYTTGSTQVLSSVTGI